MQVSTCIDSSIKSFLIDKISGTSLPDKEKRSLIDYLKEIPYCIEQKGKGKGERKKRAPSPYNLFIKDCFQLSDIKKLSGAPAKMRACGAKWKQRKGS